MQRLGFANIRTMAVTVPHWVRGEAQLAVLSPWPQPMPVLALGAASERVRKASTPRPSWCATWRR
jgi:hypothetical protein